MSRKSKRNSGSNAQIPKKQASHTPGKPWPKKTIAKIKTLLGDPALSMAEISRQAQVPKTTVVNINRGSGIRPVESKKRVAPETLQKIKDLLTNSFKTMEQIATETNVSPKYVSTLNERWEIRAGRKPFKRVSPEKRKFIERALSLAKYTPMKEIARRAGVAPFTVRRINEQAKVRDKDAIALANRTMPWKTFKTVIRLLVTRPELTFGRIATQAGCSYTGVRHISQKLGLQTDAQIEARIKAGQRRQRKPRHSTFTASEKWDIILGLEHYLGTVVWRKQRANFLPEEIHADLMQQTLLESFGALDRLPDKMKPKHWLAAVATNVVRYYSRSDTARKRRERKAATAKRDLRGNITKREPEK